MPGSRGSGSMPFVSGDDDEQVKCHFNNLPLPRRLSGAIRAPFRHGQLRQFRRSRSGPCVVAMVRRSFRGVPRCGRAILREPGNRRFRRAQQILPKDSAFRMAEMPIRTIPPGTGALVRGGRPYDDRIRHVRQWRPSGCHGRCDDRVSSGSRRGRHFSQSKGPDRHARPWARAHAPGSTDLRASSGNDWSAGAGAIRLCISGSERAIPGSNLVFRDGRSRDRGNTRRSVQRRAAICPPTPPPRRLPANDGSRLLGRLSRLSEPRAPRHCLPIAGANPRFPMTCNQIRLKFVFLP